MPASADQFADQLRGEIKSGALPVGTVLPSLRTLVKERDVTMSVVNRGLDKLKAEGLIESQHGSKNVVTGGFRRIEFTAPHGDLDPAQDVRVVRVAEVPAPAFVAAGLGIAPETDVVVRNAEKWVGRRRCGLVDHFLPVELARGSAAVYTDAGPGGVHARLAERGFRPTRFSHRAVARVGLPEELRLLGLRSTIFLLEVIRLGFAGDRCVEVVRIVLEADAFELRVDSNG